jgi:hypothetical protein
MSVLAATPGCVNPDIGDETPSFSHPSMQFPVRPTRKAVSLPCWCVQRYVGQWRCVCVCVFVWPCVHSLQWPGSAKLLRRLTPSSGWMAS